MTSLLSASPETVFFAFLRLTAFFVIVPFPGLNAPVLVKVIIAGTLASLLAHEGASPRFTLEAALIEVLLGVVAGFLVRTIVDAFTFAGEAAGTQMGLASIGFFNPLDTQMTLLGSGFTFLVLGLFAAGEGPSRLLVFLHHFLEAMPAGQGRLLFDPRLITTNVGTNLFVLGLVAASPMIAAVFCAQLVLAVLARAVPTLNLLIEGPSLTMTAGVVGFFASVHSFAHLVERAFSVRFEAAFRWLLG
ncbi:MAG: flagellar biosynthetic protein FliR [Myxococcota bacterium]